MQSPSYLSWQEIVVTPGTEWSPPRQVWTFVELAAGAGFWIARGGSLPLMAEELLVVAPDRTDGHFLASRIGGCRLWFVCLDVGALGALLTCAERRRLKVLAESAPGGFWRWTSPLPERYRAGDWASAGSSAALANRLRLAAALLEVVHNGTPAAARTGLAAQDWSTRAGLDDAISQLTQADLLRRSAQDLAAQLRCSLRHFSRLFSRRHGTSFRDKQRALRMALARRLLETTDDKVVTVALECGYQSLGLFNAVFKRHFELTPSACRRRAAAQAAGGRAPLNGPRAHAVDVMAGGGSGSGEWPNPAPTRFGGGLEDRGDPSEITPFCARRALEAIDRRPDRTRT